MSAVAQDITLEQGATFRVRVAINDQTGASVDVSLYTAAFTVHVSGQGVSLTEVDGITMGNGIIDVVVADNITDTMKAGLGSWDLFITDPLGATTKLYYGNVTVLPRVRVS